jgi:hypothetical protein
MRQSILLCLFLACATFGFGQKQTSSKPNDCLGLLNRLSSDWKLDSTGNGGFRRENIKFLLGCNLQNLTNKLLLQNLGKPNQIRDTNKGKQLLYYYYDFRTLPNEKDGPVGYAYVVFTVPNGQSFVSSIEEGDADL